MIVDPLGDMLIRIKNAGMAGREKAIVPYSKLRFEVVNVLLKNNFIKSFSVKGKKVKKHIEIEIAYGPDNRTPKIEDVSRQSKPSRRVYVGYRDVRPVKQGQGMAVISTPKGLMTEKESRKAKLGGELMFEIW